jgi:RND family efflux transporter MFP subunit
MQTAQRELAGIRTVAAAQESLAHRIRTVGVVAVDETRVQHLHVKIAGYVEKLYINTTGQYVRRGQPALAIYSPELLASQEEFLRARQAAQRFAASAAPEVRRGGEDLLRAARRRLELLDVPSDFIAALESTGTVQRAVTLNAHASGFVTMKSVVEGQQVEPGMEVFTLADLSRVWVEANFYENEARLVRAGQAAMLELPFDPAKRFDGKVAYVQPVLDPETRTLRVRFEFANRDLALKPAMYVNVTLEVESALAVVVPEAAVLDSGTRQIVFVETAPNHFEPRVVRAGRRAAGKIEIIDGISAGEAVVDRANFLLDSESRLRGALSGAGAGHAHGEQPR